MAAAYLLYLAVFGLYTNLWTQQLDWLLVVPLLLIVGAFAEDPSAPPGLTGRAWGRIRRMTGRAEASDSIAKPAGDAPRDRGERKDRKLARGLVLAGIGVVALLLGAGLLIQPLLKEPYPQLASIELPSSVAGSAGVMTNSDRPNDNEPLVWVRGRGHLADVYSYTPGRPRTETERLARIRIPQAVGHSQFDINYWPPWRAQALYSFEQRLNNLSIAVSPTWKAEGRQLNFRAPLSLPPAGTTREFMIANWGGVKPDLFVITRGDPQSRPVLQILSGESGFRRQLYASRLPYRGLDSDAWSVEIAPIIGLPDKSENRIFKGERLDLVLIHHDPDEEHSMVHVLVGESGFEWDAVRRDLDNSGAVPPGTDFLIGSHQGATAIYEVHPRGANGPHLKVFGLTNPPPLQ
jgi:hypothetical protein